MPAHVIDGRAVARHLKATLAAEVEHSRHAGVAVGLATLLVGGQFGATAYERRLARLAAGLDEAEGEPPLILRRHRRG